MDYTIDEHRHRFAAWAASRAASVKGCRFTVKVGKRILEDAGFVDLLKHPSMLPDPQHMDLTHRDWRKQVISAASSYGPHFTHGVAAKLINVYLKSAYVCGGHHDDPRVRDLHPPIDGLLLDSLYRENVGGLRHDWSKTRKTRWSRLNSDEYENLISTIRKFLGPDRPLWELELYWRGYQ